MKNPSVRFYVVPLRSNITVFTVKKTLCWHSAGRAPRVGSWNPQGGSLIVCLAVVFVDKWIAAL